MTESQCGFFTLDWALTGCLLSASTRFRTTAYTYDGRGAMATREVEGQPALAYSYDPVGNLTGAFLPQGAATLAYDPRNMLSDIARTNGITSSFAHDVARRLLSITQAPRPRSTIDRETCRYDPAGNRNVRSTIIGQALVTQHPPRTPITQRIN